MPENSTTMEYQAVIPYIVPMAVFAVFTYGAEVVPVSPGILYLIKTVLTATALYYFRNEFRHEIQLKFSLTATLAGIVVFVIWVASDGLYPYIRTPGFNPYDNNSATAAFFTMTIRLLGATLVVPIMEEVFWRSFALRYLIRFDFRSVTLGAFSWFSFITVSIAFGLAHHHWLPGIATGMIFAWTLYRSKNLFEPILAHGVANFLLGIYVIQTQSWSFW